MLSLDTLILLIGVLLLLGIASSKFSARLGVPMLVMFLGLGMLAGSEGIGGIHFENYALANAFGTVALGLILFDGGLRTPYRSIRAAWRPAGVLATAGVLMTAVVTGMAAAWVLRIPLLEGLLLGSIVGSTDAAAVFSILRSGGVHIRRRLAETLEVESGSNDPMAIFLTVGLIEVLAERVPLGPGLLWLLLTQVAFGVIVGLLVGWVAVWAINHSQLSAAGLYPVLATAFGLFSFGAAASLGGSGFLSVYLTGIVLGNSRLVFQRGVLLFHDAAAWLGQILMFVMLGLLSFPSRLLEVAVPGLLVAAVLVFLARPAAVFVSVFPFRFSLREQLFLSWVGLKGAVPITLATFPLLQGLPGASLMFDIVFFVVLVSAVVQGWTLPAVARRLNLEVPARREAPVTLELSSLRHVDGDIVDYFVDTDSRAAGRMVQDLALPEGVVVALIARQQQIVPPQGRSRIEAGDHVIVVLHSRVRPLVDRVFARRELVPDRLPAAFEFPLRGSTKVSDLERFYDIRLGVDPEATLDEAMRARLGKKGTAVGATVEYEQIALRVRGVTPAGVIENVGMMILPPALEAPAEKEAAPADEANAPPTETQAKEETPPSQPSADADVE